MDISSQEIEAIVKQVLAGMGGAQTSAAPAAYTAAPGGAAGDRGVFENVDDAVEAAWKAQRDWAANYKIEDRQRTIEAIRRCARAHVEEWCHKIVEETGMGRYEDKVEKHLAVINKTPGPECLTTEAKSGDAGLMLEEYAPFGVICSITPTTRVCWNWWSLARMRPVWPARVTWAFSSWRATAVASTAPGLPATLPERSMAWARDSTISCMRMCT